MRATEAGSVVLRSPRKTDVARVREIVEATGVFRADEVEVALEVFIDAVTAPGKDYFALGAYDDARLIGFACYGPTPCTLSTWDLYWIAVDPEVQRLGIGRRLMEACEKAVSTRDGQLIVIETASRADYATTRAFYEMLGYERAARISHYYAPGDDLVVFAKHLGSSLDEGGHHG